MLVLYKMFKTCPTRPNRYNVKVIQERDTNFELSKSHSDISRHEHAVYIIFVLSSDGCLYWKKQLQRSWDVQGDVVYAAMTVLFIALF